MFYELNLTTDTGHVERRLGKVVRNGSRRQCLARAVMDGGLQWRWNGCLKNTLLMKPLSLETSRPLRSGGETWIYTRTGICFSMPEPTRDSVRTYCVRSTSTEKRRRLYMLPEEDGMEPEPWHTMMNVGDTSSHNGATSHDTAVVQNFSNQARPWAVSDPDVISLSRKLLETESTEMRWELLDEFKLTGGKCQKLLTIMGQHDAVDVALEVCRWMTISNSWSCNEEETIMWTKVMKMSLGKSPVMKSCMALKVYDEMQQYGVHQDRVCFNTAIDAAGKCKRWNKVLELRKTMDSRGIKPDSFTYNNLLSACKRSGNWKQAVQWFEEIEAPNAFHYATLMTTLQRGGAWEESIQWFKKMDPEKGVKPDVVCYNAAISACAKGGDWQQAWAIFGSMRREGIRPTVISYNALLSACERCGQAERALEVFNNMKKRGVRCNPVTYNTLISSCAKSGKFEKTMEIYREMGDRGVPEDVFTLTGLLTACGRVGDWKRGLRLFKDFKKRGTQPNVVAYNQLISVLGDQLEWRRALAAWDAMEEDGIQPDVVTYGALLSALDKAGQWREALHLYDRLLDSNLEANIYIFASVLNACERGRQWDRATELFRNMLQSQGDMIPMSSIAFLARKAMYSSPAGVNLLLNAMPEPLVRVSSSVVNSGRAARQWIWKSSSSQNQ